MSQYQRLTGIFSANTNIHGRNARFCTTDSNNMIITTLTPTARRSLEQDQARGIISLDNTVEITGQYRKQANGDIAFVIRHVGTIPAPTPTVPATTHSRFRRRAALIGVIAGITWIAVIFALHFQFG